MPEETTPRTGKVELTFDPATQQMTMHIKGIQVWLKPNIIDEENEKDYQPPPASLGNFRILRKEELNIYCPDGIGDLHWIFLKLGDLKRKCGAKKIHLYIRDISPIRPKRADDFVKMNPIIDDLTYVGASLSIPTCGYAVEANGYDYLLDATPILAAGQRIEKWIPELQADYEYPLYLPKAEPLDCAAIYYGDHLAEVNWASGWADHHWAILTQAMAKKAQVQVLGLECDRSKIEAIKRFKLDIVDLVGKTNFLEALKIAMGARVFVGSVSGLTILAAHAGARCVVFWPGAKARLRLPVEMWTGYVKNRPFYKPMAYNSEMAEVLATVFSIWREQ